tara:strand:+ start:1 stop:642 length:642 start_codon:yes stop_codon:yes gene_type:complete
MLKRLIQTIQLLYVKIKWIIFGESKSQQIELFLPINTNIKFQHIMLPEDYKLRTYFKNDFTELQQLYLNVGFKDMSLDNLKNAINLAVPGGIFIITHKLSNNIVGAFMSRHMSDEEHYEGGRIDWLAVDLKHRGHNLGLILTITALNRLKSIGYKNIHVTTDDQRLSAIKTFLKVGLVPDINSKEMNQRWSKICKLLNVSFLDDEWAKLKNDI